MLQNKEVSIRKYINNCKKSNYSVFTKKNSSISFKEKNYVKKCKKNYCDSVNRNPSIDKPSYKYIRWYLWNTDVKNSYAYERR